MSSVRVAIIDYDAGNLRSVQRACAEVGIPADVTYDATQIRDAERIIFPGVGAAGAAMRVLKARGLDALLLDAFHQGKPILGICLGLQISFEHSEENNTRTLGILPGRVRRFQLNDRRLKVPHMGWNEVVVRSTHPVLQGLAKGDACYFVHSYYPEPANAAHVLAVTDYELTFACAVGHANYVATQFHPEKSGRVGLDLLSRFGQWQPATGGNEC